MKDSETGNYKNFIVGTRVNFIKSFTLKISQHEILVKDIVLITEKKS